MYHSEDITFCNNHKCPHERCEMNPMHIKDPLRPHSFADYENTKYCRKMIFEIVRELEDVES